MKKIVSNNEEYNGYLTHGHFYEQDNYYSIDCNEFKEFANNNRNKIYIKTNTNLVSHITTDIDRKGITYRLTDQLGHDRDNICKQKINHKYGSRDYCHSKK